MPDLPIQPSVRRMPPPEAMDAAWTVPSMLLRAVERHGHRPFLQIVDGPAETYSEAYQQAQRVAALLQALGVQAQDKVLIMLPNGLDVIHGWLGANLLNAVDVSINTGYRGKSLEHAANLSGAKLMLTSSVYLDVLGQSASALESLKTIVIVDDGPASNAALANAGIKVLRRDSVQCDQSLLSTPAVPVQPWDIGSVIYTSGTSGPAKGVLMPHGQISLLAQLTVARTGLSNEDVFFSFYPMYHMAGKFMSVLATLHAGGKLVLDTGFTPEQWLNRIRQYSATVTAAHGPMLEMVFALPETDRDREHKLRMVRTAPFPKRIAAAFEERFGVRGIEVWGMTEIGIPCWTDPDVPSPAGSCGRIDSDWYELGVVDQETDALLERGQVGEFVVRPKMPWTLMQGYLGMPEKTVATWRNFWFHTGDCGKIDANGYAYFVDRASDRIRRRAENISSSDIEAAALTHEGVAEAVAVGKSSGYEGDDDILLSVVLKPGVDLAPEMLMRFLAPKLPHYMIPRYLQYVENFPRTATGKIQRSAVKARVSIQDLWDRKAARISIRDLLAG